MTDPLCTDPLNSFSLVSYLPDPLGSYLDKVRQQLVPNCTARSHVTILPPRPLDLEHVSQEQACNEIRERCAMFPPFRLDLLEIGTFDQSAVVYIDIGRGKAELLEMHQHLNSGWFRFAEPHNYQPHITLAQKFCGSLEEMTRLARAFWDKTPARSVEITTLTFVRSAGDNTWVDLVRCDLLGALAAPER